MTRRRIPKTERKLEIINAALRVASRPGGWSKLTRSAVAGEAECTEGLVSLHFGTMLAFRRTVMRAAIVAEELGVIAQGLAAGDKCAQKADPELKARALNTLAG